MNHWLYHCHLWLIKVHWFRDFLLIHLPLMPYQHWQHTKNFSCGLIRWNIEYIRSLTSKCISNLQYKIRHYFLKTGIHSMQGWTATTGHGATRKRSTKIVKHTRNHAIYQNNKETLKKKEVEPVESVVKNIYQSNIYRKDLSWPHFNYEPRVQEKQQVQDQVLHICFCSLSNNSK